MQYTPRSAMASGAAMAFGAAMFTRNPKPLWLSCFNQLQWLLRQSIDPRAASGCRNKCGFVTIDFGLSPGLEYLNLLVFGSFVLGVAVGHRAALWAAAAGRWQVCGWPPWVKVWVLDVGGSGNYGSQVCCFVSSVGMIASAPSEDLFN